MEDTENPFNGMTLEEFEHATRYLERYRKAVDLVEESDNTVTKQAIRVFLDSVIEVNNNQLRDWRRTEKEREAWGEWLYERD